MRWHPVSRSEGRTVDVGIPEVGRAEDRFPSNPHRSDRTSIQAHVEDQDAVPELSDACRSQRYIFTPWWSRSPGPSEIFSRFWRPLRVGLVLSKTRLHRPILHRPSHAVSLPFSRRQPELLSPPPLILCGVMVSRVHTPRAIVICYSTKPCLALDTAKSGPMDHGCARPETP